MVLAHVFFRCCVWNGAQRIVLDERCLYGYFLIKIRAEAANGSSFYHECTLLFVNFKVIRSAEQIANGTTEEVGDAVMVL